MRILLDTHALLWWFSGSRQLSSNARQSIEDEDNDILISAASAWEITIKYRIGKLHGAEALVFDIPSAIASQGFEELPITVDDAARAGLLPSHHRDPFDRMLIAQALSRNLPLVSIEPVFDDYGVRRLW